MNKQEWIAWLQENDLDCCFWCGRYKHYGSSLCTHHIAKGAGRKDEPCNMMRVCANPGACHDKIHARPEIMPRHELAMKALGDPEHYDRRRVNQLRGRAPEAIAEYEVIQACKELQ